VLVVFLWGWLFQGWTTICGSKNAESVDKLNDMTALIPKIRFMVDSLPKWMLPKGFDMKTNATYMNIYNPVSNNSILGEANAPTFATGTRAKAILFDEFAKWEYTDREAWTSAGAASPCRVAVSTPVYKNNKFFDLKNSEIEHLRVHYSENPGKNEEWKLKEQKRFSEQEWAQEFEIDYSGTAHAVVFAEELAYLRLNSRINERIQFLPGRPIYIAADLGIGDSTFINCAQTIGHNEEIRLFEEYQNNNKSVFHYIEWIKSADRIWNKREDGKYHEGWRDCVVIPDPNQASNRELTSGKSIVQILQEAEFEVQMRWIGSREGISVCKKMMKRLWIAPTCTDIIDALEGYHYDYDDKRGEYKPEPYHDKNSHGCKSLIYLAAYLQEPEDFEQTENEGIFIPDYSQVSSAGL
jgi:hypothetical protein